MIIGVLIVSLLAFALTNVFAKKTWQTFLSLIFGLIFVASLSLIVANLSNHFGMEKVTETKTEKIVSSADSQGADMLLYKALGNGKEKVYLYRTNEKQEKPKATGTDNETNKVEKTDGDAEKVTKTTYWEYKNDMYKSWFNIADNNHEYDSRVNTFKIPETWVELSTDQAAKLAELVKKQQSTMESEAKAYVQDGMVKAMTENPKMSKAEQEQRTKALAAEFQQQAFAKLVKEAKGE
ncbi:DUF4811 domain-containing protein [Enterococcus faecium]|uniref:DUF4811 domain-containing protein n=1 Tax=Enterococcus faecium TaxID=1352 RepID=UPI0018C22F81|nr:DUF4811 domain-containing protein [Enterococcus faecium]MBG0500725.1 DUF4811 domain-containing protein [Enterococcus faecium]